MLFVIKQPFGASFFLKISVAGTLYETAGNSCMGNGPAKNLTVIIIMKSEWWTQTVNNEKSTVYLKF